MLLKQHIMDTIVQLTAMTEESCRNILDANWMGNQIYETHRWFQKQSRLLASCFSEYNFGDQPDGLRIFKAIIATGQVDSPATISQIQYNLMGLAQHMQDIDSDIEQCIMDAQTYAFEACGNTTSDLLVYLLRLQKCIQSNFQEVHCWSWGWLQWRNLAKPHSLEADVNSC